MGCSWHPAGEFLVELHPISTSPLTLRKDAAPTGHLAIPHYASDLSVSPLSPSSLLCPGGTQRPPPCLSGVLGLKGSRCPRASTASTYLSPSVRDREFPLTAENSALKTVCVPSRPGMGAQKQREILQSVLTKVYLCIHTGICTHTHTHTHSLLPHTHYSLTVRHDTCHNLWCVPRFLPTQSHSEQSPLSLPAGASLCQRPLLRHIPASFLFFSAALQGLWDLTSLTGNGSQAPQQRKRRVLTTGQPGKTPHSPHWSSEPHTCNHGKCHLAREQRMHAHTHPRHCALSPPHPRNRMKFEARPEG